MPRESKTRSPGRRPLSAPLALACLLAGCAGGEYAPRERAVWLGDQGSSAELVFPGAAVLERQAATDPFADARNDARLSSRAGADARVDALFPGDPRPSLDDLRVRYIRSNNPDAVYYYTRQRPAWDTLWVVPVYPY